MKIGSHYVPAFWPFVKGFLLASIEAVDLGRFDTIEGDLLAGRADLWIVDDGGAKPVGAGVTLIDITHKTRAMVIYAYAGDGYWETMLRQVEQHARDNKCDAVRIYGRRGWERLLPGYKPIGVILERRIKK